MLERLNVNSELFNQLSSSKPLWWQSLVADPEIIIEIRKKDKIDAYYNGGCIMKDLSYQENQYRASIHFEYICLQSEKDYVDYTLTDNTSEFDTSKLQVIKLNNFDSKAMDTLKKRIAKFYDSESEKYIQSQFIQHDPYFIDSEFAISANGKQLRIDLVRVDVPNQSIVFIEVKKAGDQRLYDGKVVDQLTGYHNMIRDHKDEILQYYETVFQIKKKLGILPEGLKNLDTIQHFSVVDKPLLLFGDCTQQWIDKDAEFINEQIKNVAVGAYYLGKPKYSCSLIAKVKLDNRYMFMQ